MADAKPTLPLLDQRLVWFLDANREGVLQLLRVDQSKPAVAANVALALQTLKTGAEAVRGVVEHAVAVAEKERLVAETEKIQAETERLVAEKGRLYAEKDKINAETERFKAGGM